MTITRRQLIKGGAAAGVALTLPLSDWFQDVAHAESERLLGEIMLFGGNFAPAGWALCDGQLLPISENDVLFTLLGTTYGGDGDTNFALPDLRGRVPVHQGQGLTLAQVGGAEGVTLTRQQIPAHNHRAVGSSLAGTQSSPAGGVWARSTTRPYARHAQVPLQPMSDATLSAAGGSQPHENMLPFSTLTFCIHLFGTFPNPS